MERWSTEQLQYSCRVLVVFIFASASLEKFQLVSCPDQKVLSPVKVYFVKYYVTSNVLSKLLFPTMPHIPSPPWGRILKCNASTGKDKRSADYPATDEKESTGRLMTF